MESPAKGPDASRAVRPRIYHVEDEDGVARLVGTTLTEFGFDVSLLRTGAEMLRRLRGDPPDLCIIDLGLPDMDGMDLVRQIRNTAGCGVLILTARTHAVDRVIGLELGADDYVVKPFEPRELVARVRSILRRCGRGLDDSCSVRTMARFNGWRFAAATNTLSAPDGEEFCLSTAESQLLRVFLEHPNRILTREQLLGERDVSPFDRSIDVRISRLRRKLEIDPQNPKLIKTVYGAGYLFSGHVDWD